MLFCNAAFCVDSVCPCSISVLSQVLLYPSCLLRSLPQDPSTSDAAQSVSNLSRASRNSPSPGHISQGSAQVTPSSSDSSITVVEQSVADRVQLLLDRGLIKLLVQLAGKGTMLNSTWTLPHLEVSSLSLSLHFHPSPSPIFLPGNVMPVCSLLS